MTRLYTVTDAEALPAEEWTDGEGWTHHRDEFRQWGHHKAGPDCACGPTKEEK